MRLFRIREQGKGSPPPPPQIVTPYKDNRLVPMPESDPRGIGIEITRIPSLLITVPGHRRPLCVNGRAGIVPDLLVLTHAAVAAGSGSFLIEIEPTDHEKTLHSIARGMGDPFGYELDEDLRYHALDTAVTWLNAKLRERRFGPAFERVTDLVVSCLHKHGLGQDRIWAVGFSVLPESLPGGFGITLYRDGDWPGRLRSNGQ